MLQFFLKTKLRSKQSGITLIETIIYAIILLLVLLVIIAVLGALTGSHRRAMVNRLVESSGAVAMEKIGREIRSAEAVNVGSSALGVNLGTLALSGLNAGTPYEVIFNTAGGILQVSKDGGPAGNLTSSAVTVTKLLFERITNANSEGVRITLELEAQYGNEIKTLRLNNFIVLRGSY